MKGYLTFVLHTHLPYVVNHGKWPFGEEWLYEAMSESYVPLIMELDRLRSEGVKFQLVVGITPILAEQLADPGVKERFAGYMERKLKAMEEDLQSGKYEERAVSYMLEYFREVYDYWRGIDGGVLGKFKQLQDEGYVEIVTSSATHAYLPLLGRDEAIRAQIANGIATYERHFGRRPRGIWLPECAYRPSGEWELPSGRIIRRKGIEKFLEEFGIEYFFVESNLIDGGTVNYSYGVPAPIDSLTTLRPYRIRGSNVVVFGRNRETGYQVWSAHHGYPGDYWYREFHRKAEKSGGQYWRITGKDVPLGSKEFYDPEKAMERVEEHAKHFVKLVLDLLETFRERTGETGIIVSPYDTELFGHWWFEGVRWLGRVLELLSSANVETTTISRFLDEYTGEKPEITLPEGSWGKNSDHSTWWNLGTEEIWEKVHLTEDRMVGIASRYYGSGGLVDRAIEQMARELLLLEASDWEFLVTTGQAREYGFRRANEHFTAFHELANELLEYVKGRSKEVKSLEEYERIDRPFDDVIVSPYISDNPPKVLEWVDVRIAENEGSDTLKQDGGTDDLWRHGYAFREAKEPERKQRGEEQKGGDRDVHSWHIELTDVKGIGPKRSMKLRMAGINTVEDLITADPLTVSRRTKISEKLIRKFIKQAKELINARGKRL